MARIIARRQRQSRRAHGALTLAFTTAIFVVAFVVGYANLPDLHGQLRWHFFALSGILGSPALLLLVAAEYDASVRLLRDSGVPLNDAFRVGVFATAANVLPIPGSVIVRTAAMRRMGLTLQGALFSTGAMGISWLATGALLIGLAVLMASPGLFGFLLSLTGFLGLAAVYVVIRKRRSSNSLFARIVVVESAFVVVSAARFFLVLTGLGLSPSPHQAAALTLGGMIASVAGVFPSGLGIRELLSGLISPLIGLPASVGVVAASIVRLADFPVVAPLSFAFLHRQRRTAVHRAESFRDDTR